MKKKHTDMNGFEPFISAEKVLPEFSVTLLY